MTAIMRTITLLLISAVILAGGLSCGSSISQEEYDRVKSDLSAAMSQVSELQQSLSKAAASAGEGGLDEEIEAVRAELEDLTGEYAALKTLDDARIDAQEALQAEYDRLQALYDQATSPAGEVLEEDIEQALFALINQERTSNGQAALLWGNNLSLHASTNNLAMVEKKEYQYHEMHAVQEVYWATGYDTADEIAAATMEIWKNYSSRYRQNILNVFAVYGAVDAHKSGDIYYITYIADAYP